MKGYPKNLNTKADYEYVKANFPREAYLPSFQALLDTMNDWFFVKELAAEAEGITDETHKVLPMQETGGTDEAPKSWAQYEYRVNPTCKLLSLGLTEAEVRAVVAG